MRILGINLFTQPNIQPIKQVENRFVAASVEDKKYNPNHPKMQDEFVANKLDYLS